MKALLIAFLFIFSAGAFAQDFPINECSVFSKKAENGDRCPNFGVSYKGQRIGPGGSSGCYRTAAAAREAIREMSVCRNSGRFGDCTILARGLSSCANFRVVDEYGAQVCFRTAQSAYEGMLSSPSLSCL